MARPVADLIRANKSATTLLVFFGVIALWSGAVPMFGTPDEPAHMVRAAGLVRGQLDGEIREDNKSYFEVPAILSSGIPCYAFKPEQSADCLNVPADKGMTMVASSAGGNPPFFHAVTGLPTLVTSGLLSLYFMRAANGLMCATLLTLALRNVAILKRPGPVAFGFAVSLTPMVLFLSGPVNSSGVAIASGMAIWTAVLVLLDANSPRPVDKSAIAFAVPFCILLLSRRDGTLWGASIVLIVLILVPWQRLKEILRVRSVWAWSGVIALTVGAQSVLWGNESASGFSSAGQASGGSAKAAFNVEINYLYEAIGRLGWLDTRLPAIVYLGWALAIFGMVFGAVAVASRRDAFAVVGAVFLVIGLTVYIGSVRFPYFQGRYYLPFAVGIPLLAGNAITAAGYHRVPRRVLVIGLGWLLFLHQLAFAQQLRRYAVGSTGSWNFVFDHRWSPTPGPIWAFLLAYLAASMAMMTLIAAVALSGGDARRPSPSNGRTPQQTRAARVLR